MPKTKISAIIIVYNEENRIKECLNTVKGVVDEIILVHDGPCTDKTLLYAKKYTNKIFERPRWGDPSPHRPFALGKASGEWVLAIDADERLSKDLQKNLRKLTQNKQNIDGFSFYWPFHYKGMEVKKGPLSKHHRLALFKKSKTTISGKIHDWFRVDGKIQQTNLMLDHKQVHDNVSFKTFFKKSGAWWKVDARYRIENNHAEKPAIWYLIKAPIWFMLYTIYFLVIQKLYLHGILGLRLAILNAIYNFMLYFTIFKMKLSSLR